MDFYIFARPRACFASGSAYIRLTNDHPVELLLSSTGSKSYQIKQMIIVPNNQSYWNCEHPSNFQKTIQIGPMFRKDFLHAAFELYQQVPVLNSSFAQQADATQRIVTLGDNWLSHCAVVMSVFNYYFQSFWSHIICALFRLVKSVIVLAMLARGRPLGHCCHHINLILMLISHATAFIQPMSSDKDLSGTQDDLVRHLELEEQKHERAAMAHIKMAQQMKLLRMQFDLLHQRPV
uniref:MSP domain-containing protein n=1 Tax=Globodera pallida TaxID=36090 RepID=A0A183BVM7_GLOPA